jgi:Flp pilus assembly protein TadD
MKRGLWILGGILLLAATAWPALDWYVALPPGRQAEYVGRAACADCHAREVTLWEGSDHDRAMDLATPEFVLGDFDNTELTHHGVVSRMSRRGDEFFVETEGPDGQRAEFRVKYVFGYRPLQQYLAELDRGYLQVLPVTWDTEQREWFYAVPDAPFGPGDPLHWTGSAQNWNHMCADCHSTDFQKNFDLASATHHPSYSEIDVSCEACHGPGSLHIELAKSHSLFWDRRYGYGLAKLKDTASKTQLEACAPCHARRQRIYPGFQPGDEFFDYFGLSLLEEGLYHPDGQFLDEVYEYGSFTQSLMYRKNVRCSDCHDPHTTRVKFPDNRLCTQCHIAGKYDGPVHHHHDVRGEGSRCVACHMPVKKYMVVDPRRDHSLRPPRPDLTVKLGTPNACNQCHTRETETAQWAADWIVQWYGPTRKDNPHYGELIAAGRAGAREAIEPLAKLTRSADVGPIVRATAASLLATRYPISDTREAIERSLRSPDAIVRVAALRAVPNWPITSRRDLDELRDLLAPRLSDSSRWVRVEAARMASSFPSEIFTAETQQRLQRALDECQTGLLAEGDQSGSHMGLGILRRNLGDVSGAIRAYETAIRLDPAVAGPRSNLASELEQLGRQREALALRQEEVQFLRRDAELLPDNAFLKYQLGLLEYLLNDEAAAERALLAAVRLAPDSADFLLGLTLLYEKQQRWSEALPLARRLTDLEPQNPSYQQVLRNLQEASRTPP